MSIAVLIPSYDRPEILKLTLPLWLKAKCVSKVFLLVQASTQTTLEKYREVLEKFKDNKLVYKVYPRKIGSVDARNILLDIAVNYPNSYEYLVIADDDYLLPNEKGLKVMINDLKLHPEVGAVGGKVSTISRRKVDPEFFLNLPLNLADLLTKLSGYIFLDIKHGPRYAEFMPQFFVIRKSLLRKGIRYNRIYNTPTSFREESDFQQQIKHLGYKLFYDPRAYVIHLTVEKGGNRPKIDMGRRIYWKTRNHIIFILKWNTSTLKRIWYMLFSTILLLLYRPWHFLKIFKGIRDGVNIYSQYTSAINM